MTLLLSNDEVEALLPMPECLAAMEDAYRELGDDRGANGVRSEILTPTDRRTRLYSLLTMAGVVPKFGIGAVRDQFRYPDLAAVRRGAEKRVKVPAAPNGRYVGLVLLFSAKTGEPLAIYPDGVVQRMRVGGDLRARGKISRACRMHRDVGAARHRLAGRRPGDGDRGGAPDQAHPLLQSRCAGGAKSICRGDEREARHRRYPPRKRARGRSGRRRRRHVRDQQHAACSQCRVDRAWHACQQPEAARARRPGGGCRRCRRHACPQAPSSHRATAGADLARETETEKAALSKALEESELARISLIFCSAARRADERKGYDARSELYGPGLSVRGHRTRHLPCAQKRGIGREDRHRLVDQRDAILSIACADAAASVHKGEKESEEALKSKRGENKWWRRKPFRPGSSVWRLSS